MKKAIIISISSIIIASAAYLGYRVFTTIQQKKIKEANAATLPVFSFVTKNNQTFSKADVPNIDKKIIFNFFSPTCEHCQYMATQYLKHKEQLKDISILMVTIADSNSIAKFEKDYTIDSIPTITLLRDPKFQFYKTFGTATVPCFFIYENKKLLQKIIGETKIENLIAPITSSKGGN